jgi:hypothetical protein
VAQVFGDASLKSTGDANPKSTDDANLGIGVPVQ